MTKRTWLAIAAVLGGIAVAISAILGWLFIAKVLGIITLVTSAALGLIQLIDILRRKMKQPIRVDSWYSSAPIEGVVLDGFDPNKGSSYYLQDEGRIAYAYPTVNLDVVGQRDGEEVKIAPYLVVDVNEIKPIPENADYVAYRFHGAGAAAINVFVATFAPVPERTGVFYAPQATADAVPGEPRIVLVENPDYSGYFTLATGEREVFHLEIFMVPGCYYRFRVGVLYTYRGQERVAWGGEEYVAAIPLKAEVWLSDWRISEEQPFQRMEDLEDLRKAGLPWIRKYTSTEAAEAIERENQEVQRYGYHSTPPHEIDRARQ